MQVHQFHPTVSFGDATSNQILALRKILQDHGYESHIFCERLPEHFPAQVYTIEQYDFDLDAHAVLLVHFSLGYSPAVMEWLAKVQNRKILMYHNITPHRYFAGVNPIYFDAAREGREQLKKLRALVDDGWGVSSYNCQELAENGWPNPQVLPIIFNPERYELKPDPKVMKACTGTANILFVGRLVPNKCFEDLILIFYYLKHFVRPDAKLYLVGSSHGMAPYMDFLEALLARLELEDVVFTGHINNEALMAYYECTNLYLSMSEHEGFGIPLIESMHFELPVVAYRAAAIPETLNGSGVLVRSKKHHHIAELIGILLEDEHLRAQIVARQKERVRDFYPDRISQRFIKMLSTSGVEGVVK